MKEMRTLTIDGVTYKIVDGAVGSLDDLRTANKGSLVSAVNEVHEKTELASRLSLGVHSDGLVYLFIDGAPVGSGIELSSGGISGYVDSENNIIINGLPDGSYTVKYELTDGSTINIGDLVLDSNVYYSVTNVLTNCVNSNSATEIVSGESYEATITPNSGYELKSVAVTMGGQSVSVSGGTISIANVTGNIVITAVAKEAVVVPSYTNLLPLAVDTDGSPYNGGKGYKSGYKMSTSSGNESATTGAYCSGFMPVSSIYDAIRVKNVTLSSAANVNNFTFYDASKTKVGNNACNGSAGAFHASVVDEGNGVYRVQPKSYLSTSQSVAFFRFSCGGITDETIVTVNEEIV